MRKIIILLGLPGSGKGTQADFLVQKLGFSHISTGDIFRKMATESGQEAESLGACLLSGKLVSDQLVNKIVEKFLGKQNNINYILDGYPRTIEQANYFFAYNQADVTTIFFDITEKLVLERIEARFTCAECGKIYNEIFTPLKKMGICDQCRSTNFDFRGDDKAEIIKHRMSEYIENTLPIISVCQEKGKLFTIDAVKSQAEISAELVRITKNI